MTSMPCIPRSQPRSVGTGVAGWMILLPCLLFSCQTDYPEPTVSLAEFYLADPNFQIECIAAEPLVEAPVALAFDEKNRIWVVEMPSYMPNLNGTGENEPTGKIVILEDRDGDGKPDHRKIFLDSLVLPRALALVYGGVLYAEPPNLWFVKIENDRPGKRTLVDSLYAAGGNVEHQPNGLLLNLDNWIYSAKSDARYRLRNGKWEKQTTFFRGQWGITHDDLGRLFYNDNSNVLQGDFFLPNVLERNPAWRPRYGLGQQICEDQRVFPLQATSVNRGYVEGMLDEEGKLKKVTSACGPVIYAGENFPPEFYGNAFVCAPEANVVKRLILSETGDGRITARQAYQGKEFLASTDETFRPVNLFNAPDGCLYLLDMRRGIIQHKTYMTSYLRKQLEDKGLDSVSGKGRIYRFRWKGKSVSRPPDFSRLENNELIALLAQENGFVRSKAQQMLVERMAVEIAGDLVVLIEKSENPAAANHALWTLEGLGKLDETALQLSLKRKENQVPATAMHLLELQPKAAWQSSFLTEIQALISRKDALLDLALAAYLLADSLISLQRLAAPGSSGGVLRPRIPSIRNSGSQNPAARTGISTEFSERSTFLREVLLRHPQDSLFSEATISALAGNEAAFLSFLQKDKSLPSSHPIFFILETAIANRKALAQKPHSPRILTDQLTHGLRLFTQLCAACHRPGGEGIPHIAPPLLGSKMASGSVEKIADVIWNGKYTGAFSNAMPAFADNPALAKTDVEAIAAYVKNAFGEVF